MYLDAVSNLIEVPVSYSNGHESSDDVFAAWKDWEPSSISHHGGACCEIVREWVGATDCSLMNGSNCLSGPRWIRQRFEWGPTRYPVYWCSVLKNSVLDCGVHAALAEEVFFQRGVRCFRAQLVQEFSKSAAAQWQLSWKENDAITSWINDHTIYHEGCAVMCGSDSLKIWDSSAGWWLDPKSNQGYGSLLALKLTSNRDVGELSWGTHSILMNEWQTLS
jgi:hypothetical protein